MQESVLNIEKVSYYEYLNALEIVMRFNSQLQGEIQTAKLETEKRRNNQANGELIDILRKQATKRVVNAVTFFLLAEIRFNKIPFATAESVTVSFFAENYKLEDLKKIRNLGTNSYASLIRVLHNIGYPLLP